jgi:hypothetical protein
MFATAEKILRNIAFMLKDVKPGQQDAQIDERLAVAKGTLL